MCRPGLFLFLLTCMTSYVLLILSYAFFTHSAFQWHYNIYLSSLKYTVELKYLYIILFLIFLFDELFYNFSSVYSSICPRCCNSRRELQKCLLSHQSENVKNAFINSQALQVFLCYHICIGVFGRKLFFDM